MLVANSLFDRCQPRHISFAAPQNDSTFSYFPNPVYQATVDIPDDTLEALKPSPETAGNTLRMAAAAKFCEMGRLSTGAAAQLADVSRSVFLPHLAD